MSLLTILQEDMKNAMRARDQARLDAIRMLISAIKYAIVDKPELDEAGMVAVLSKEAKKRREAIEAYKAAGRAESAEKEQFELTLIVGYLPRQLTEDEVKAKLMAVKAELVGKNMGEAMKVAMATVQGQAEGGTVARIVKELMSA